MKNFTGQKFGIILKDCIIFFSFKLTVPTFKVFIKIVMFDMNRLDITHLKNKEIK
jgi:hypothetical protein